MSGYFAWFTSKVSIIVVKRILYIRHFCDGRRPGPYRAQWWRWEWQAELEQRFCGTKEWLQPYASLYRDTMKSRKLHTVLGNKKSICVMCVSPPALVRFMIK